MPRAVVPMLLLALIGPGCAGPDATGSPDDVAEWTLGAPTVSIGVLEGEEPYQLRNVTAAWKDAEGRVILADAGERAVRIFDTDGAFLHGFAPRGQGPGEIAIPWAAFPYRGDSIAVFDIGSRQVSIFDGDGAYARRVRIPSQITRTPGSIPSQSCCQLAGVLDDGSFVVHPPDQIPNEPGPPRHSRFSPLLISPDGETSVTLGTFPSRRYVYDASAPSNIRAYRLVRSFTYAVAGDRVIGGNGDSGALVVVGPGIAGVDTLRLPIEGRPVTRELVDAFGQAYRDEAERRPEFFSETSVDDLVDGEYPERAPAHGTLLADASGGLWVHRWTLPYGAEPQVVDVFSAEGEPLGHLRLPERSRILWASADELVLVERDDLDVETVRVYPIRRGGTPD